LDAEWEQLGRLKSSEKVALCLDMTEACFRTCAAGIRSQNPGITEEELIVNLHERLDWIKRSQQRGKNHGNSRWVH